MQTKKPAEAEGGRPEQGQLGAERSRRRSARLFVFVAAAAVVLGSLAYGVTSRGPGPLQEGPAPDFTLKLFDGSQLSLSELRGQVVVLNFWASWCPPCRDEAPILESAWQRYGEAGVTVIGVDYQDTEAPALRFIEEFGITYPNGPDPRSRIAKAYGVQGVPETFVITQEGEIAKVFIGSPTEEQLTAVLEDLLTSTQEE
ncbi:MAG: redoxin domain-containing protein [Anaerolineae bacterium]|nr:redoxin domain-containing protein [Anaerolineae bacterium]